MRARPETVACALGEKWVILLISALAEQERRFNELQRLVPDISKRSLTQALRNLEHDGIISRTVYATKPPSVVYALTRLRQTILGSGPIDVSVAT